MQWSGIKRKIILRIEKKGKGKHWVKSGEVSTGKGVETIKKNAAVIKRKRKYRAKRREWER